jgi:glutamate/tyrosine decarboxylase-like PLP-dependent enzyme
VARIFPQAFSNDSRRRVPSPGGRGQILDPIDDKHRIQDCLEIAFDLVRDFIAAEDRQIPYLEPGELRARLDLSLRQQPRPLREAVENLSRVLAATPSSASHRFFNQVYGGRDAVATMAELVSVVANVQMHTYKVAGPHVLIEQEVLERMSRRVGYEDGEGMFTPGGSLANMVAMIVARNEAVAGGRDQGLSAAGRLTVYSSVEGHYSIGKNMGMLGLGRHNLRQVPADEDGRMDVAALAHTIAADVAAGARPVMINATAGTTVLGAFDPLVEIAAVARRHGVWLHVDGALGGSVLLSDAHKHLAAGTELSDSFTWSAHKMMGMPLLCAAVLVKRRGLLAESFHNQAAEYLFQVDTDELNPGTRSMQCGRRNDALKLWCAWQVYGDQGYDVRIRRLFELTRKAVELVEEDPDLILSRRPQSINVCFEVAGKSSAEICERLHRDGREMVGHGVVAGRRVIRLVCVNPDITEDDLRTFFREVKAEAAELGPGENAVAAQAVPVVLESPR